MLQTIRDRAQGWIAWAIVILISIPFALWGIQEYLGVGAEPVVATVNGQKITERELENRYRQFQADLRERLGSAYRPELFKEETMRAQVLDSMINNVVLEQASQGMGLFAGDELVRKNLLAVPAFQKDGRFDRETYERALRLQGYLAPGQFEDRVRQSLITGQLGTGVRSSEFITEQELADAVRLQDQQRSFGYLRVKKADFVSEEPVDEAALQAFYENNKARFRTPERVKLDYLVLDADTLSGNFEPSEEELEAYYQTNLDSYAEPEQRRARHILITLPQDGDAEAEAAAQARIDAALERIRGGEEFAAVAREISEDPGSGPSGGDLGLFGPGAMVPEFEEAAFGAEPGQVVGPIRTQFGLHLILVDEVVPAKTQSFAEARDAVVQAVRKAEAEQKLYDYAERLADVAYESPDSLHPAAEKLGLELKTSDWMGRQGGADLLAHPKVVAAAFGDDVLTRGNNSEVLELAPNRMMVLRVHEHELASFKPLEEVKPQAEELLRAERALEAARERAESLLERLRAGETLDALQAETGYELERLEGERRDSKEGPTGLVRQVFELPRPEQGAVSYGVADLAGGDLALVALTEVKDGSLEDLKPERRDEQLASLQRASGQAYYQHLIRQLRAAAEIEITARQP